MHGDLVTPDDGAERADDSAAEVPVRPVMPRVRLGAPMVGDLDTVATPTEATEAIDPVPADATTSPATDVPATHTDTSLLRRAALLRLVGLGRSRLVR